MSNGADGHGREALGVRAALNRLVSAASNGDVGGLKKALQEETAKHPDVTVGELIEQFKDAHGRTVLHFAAHNAQAKVVDYLLEACPSAVNLSDEQGNTPLTLAVASKDRDRLEVVRALLSHGADVDGGKSGSKAKVRPIHHAAAHDDVEVLRLLAEKGADLSAETSSGTALHWAAGEGAKEAVKALVELGANVNATNDAGLTPVILASARGCGACVAALTRAGADVGFVLSGGLTALHVEKGGRLDKGSALQMAEFGCREAVEAILETETGRRCAVQSSDQHGKPINLAAFGGHRSLVELLLPYSDVKETVDQLMAKGETHAAAYEKEKVEEEKAREQKKKQQEQRSAPPSADQQPLPPEPASSEDASQAQKVKDEANRAFIAKDYDRALELYTQALALNGRDAVFWSNRSGCYMQLHRHEEALADAEMARRLKYEDAALAAYEGLRLDENNDTLKKLLQQSVELGRKEHQAKLKGGGGP